MGYSPGGCSSQVTLTFLQTGSETGHVPGGLFTGWHLGNSRRTFWDTKRCVCRLHTLGARSILSWGSVGRGPGTKGANTSLPLLKVMENVSLALGRALWVFLLAMLGSTTSQPLGGESVCTARPLARYSITFIGKWSQTAFPKQYPLFRPPAQWSSLLGKGAFPPSASSRRLQGRKQYLLASQHTAQVILI